MERVDRPISVGVGAALTSISAAWMGVGAFVVGLPGAPPLSWALVGLLWVFAGALVVSAVGIALRRDSLRGVARSTLTVLVVLLAPIAVGPYLLLNIAALAAVFASRRRPTVALNRREERPRAPAIRIGGVFGIK